MLSDLRRASDVDAMPCRAMPCHASDFGRRLGAEGQSVFCDSCPQRGESRNVKVSKCQSIKMLNAKISKCQMSKCHVWMDDLHAIMSPDRWAELAEFR